MNLSHKFIKLAARTMLLLGLAAGGAAWAQTPKCDVSLVTVFANGQAVLKADCGNATISQITWLQNNNLLSPIPPPLTVTTTQDIYYTTAIATGTSTFTATGNGGLIPAGKSATIISSAPPPPAPVCSVSASPSSVTVGIATTVTFTATCSNLPTSYAWTGSPSVSGTGSQVTVTFPATTGQGTHTYSVTATNAGGSDSKSTTVTVATTPPPAPPSCTLSASPTTITAGASSTLTSSCNPAATSYTWSGGCVGSGASCVVSPTATTTYTVTGATTAGGAGNVASATVTVGAVTPGLPANCSLVDASNYPNAVNSTSPGVVVQTQANGQDIAYRVTPNNLISSARAAGSGGGGPFGYLHFYSSALDVNIEIANSPCSFTPTPQITGNTCAMRYSGYGEKYYLGSTATSADRSLWGTSACVMPAPDATGSLYINVRLNSPTSPYAIFWENGCTGSTATC